MLPSLHSLSIQAPPSTEWRCAPDARARAGSEEDDDDDPMKRAFTSDAILRPGPPIRNGRTPLSADQGAEHTTALRHPLSPFPIEMKRAKSASSNASQPDYQTVHVLGAPLGARIRGIVPEDGISASDVAFKSVSGTILEIVKGVVWPSQDTRTLARDAYNDPDPTGWARKISRLRGKSIDLAQQDIDLLEPPIEVDREYRLGYMAASPPSSDQHSTQPMRDPAGNACRFKVISIGEEWQHLNLTVGQEVEPIALARLIHEKQQENSERIGHLCLRRNLWVQGSRSGAVNHVEGNRVDKDVISLLGMPPDTPAVYYDIEESPNVLRRYRLPESASDVLTPAVAKRVFEAMMDGAGTIPPTLWDTLEQSSVSFGALKSLMQKIVRFRPTNVTLPDGNVVNAKYVMLAATLLCASTKGDGYLPDLHISVRGSTSACKRLAIIAVEDSWPYTRTDDDDRSNRFLGLNALALVTMRVQEYNIGDAVAKIVGTFAVHMVRSKSCVAWRQDTRGNGFVKVTQQHMVEAARLMRILRSFDGDMKMLETAARMSNGGRLAVRSKPDDFAHPATVTVNHLIDQHVYRGIGHMVVNMPTGASSSTTEEDRSAALIRRFRTIFSRATGFNPRLNTTPFVEDVSPIREIRKSEELMSLKVFANQNPKIPESQQRLRLSESTISIDPSIIAQAVKPIHVVVNTTNAENAMDAAEEAANNPGAAAVATGTVPRKWELVVILGAYSADEVVVHKPLAHKETGGGRKKPNITATARRRAIERARADTQEFSSLMLPGYNQVRFEAGKWVVSAPTRSSSLPDIVWQWDATIRSTVPFIISPVDAASPRPLDDSDVGIGVAKSAILAERIAVRRMLERPGGGAAAANAEPVSREALANGIRQIVNQMAERATEQGIPVKNVHLRFMSVLRSGYSEIGLPVPSLKGGQHEKDLRPAKGDWIVYRALLLLATLVPSAIQCKSTAKLDFYVNDPRILKHVQSVYNAEVVTYQRTVPSAPSSGSSLQANSTKFERLLEHMESFFDPSATPPIGLRPHQTTIVEQMMARDEKVTATQGHFLSLDTGLGKTVIALMYALMYLSKYGTAERIVWITKANIAASALAEMERWHVTPTAQQIARGSRRVASVETHNDSPDTMFRSTITILPVESLSGNNNAQKITDRLVDLAQSTFFVIDEVHEMYNPTIRNSNAIQAVVVSPKYLCMTATPAANASQIAAREWLKGTVNFPVESKDDVLVASSSMVAGRVNLNIEEVDVDVQVALSMEAYRAHLEALQDRGGWARAASIAREAVFSDMAAKAVEEARMDRAAHPDGGVLVFMDNETEADRMVTAISALVPNSEFQVARRVPGDDSNINPTKGVIVTTMADTAGYNMQRMGATVLSVYASNAARRHQLRGRTKRIGQRRDSVRYITIIPANTILSLLYDRHNAIDAMNASLEELAQVFLMQQQH